VRTKRSKRSEPGVVKAAQPGSLGEALDQVGYRSLGRRIIIGHSGKGTPSPPWTEPVTDFVSSVLPRDPNGTWEHYCVSALEMGCELLVRLGRAKHAGYGFRPAVVASSPNRPLRWDDVATVVVSLAEQMSFLRFRDFAGTTSGEAGLLPANIQAANGSEPAYLDPETFPVLLSLGLIMDGKWTEAAETVLWRVGPQKWAVDFTSDSRFRRACDLALANVPPDVAIEIDRVATIMEQDIVDWLAVPERYSKPKTRKGALKALQFWARTDLDAIFAQRWRLTDGWLSADEANRGLAIQHDPVASKMRAAFAAKYLPHLPYLCDQREPR
jgi:hypothetical protein